MFLELHTTLMLCLPTGESVLPDPTLCTTLTSALYSSVGEDVALERQLQVWCIFSPLTWEIVVVFIHRGMDLKTFFQCMPDWLKQFLLGFVFFPILVLFGKIFEVILVYSVGPSCVCVCLV